MENPMVYPMCTQTVTVYRCREGEVSRRVAEGCYYRYKDTQSVAPEGCRPARKFLLIQPGTEEIYPGDRIYDGVGPEVAPEDWDSFLPETVPGLSQAAYAAPWHWEGHICHYEAGRK